MNILFLDQFSDLGGAQRCLLDLIPAVLARGWQAHVAAPGRGTMRDHVEALGVRYHPIQSGPYESGGKSFQDLLRFPVELPRLSLEIADLEADLIYVNGPRLLPAAALASRGRIPLIFHSHSYLPHRYAAALAGISLASSDATVIANCHYVLEPLRLFLSSNHFEVVYNGVEGGHRKLRNSSPRRIGVIGRIAREKGQLEFVRMARQLPPTFQFVICGAPLFSDPSYSDLVRKAAEGLPVEFIGWQENIEAVLSTLDLLIVPSNPYEATTRVILEAFAAGVPVIAPNSGGMSEIVSNGETGFLVSDTTKLADKVNEVMAQPALLNRVADNAYEAWRHRFTLAGYQARILSILERVGNKARA